MALAAFIISIISIVVSAMMWAAILIGIWLDEKDKKKSQAPKFHSDSDDGEINNT